MSDGARQRRGFEPLARAANAFRLRDWTITRIDRGGLRYVANIQAWLHWALGVLVVVLLLYRPFYGYWAPHFVAYLLILVLLMAFNVYFHYLVLSNRAFTWRWVFAFSAMDVILLSAAVAISDGFSHYFFHLLYYPPLAFFAIVITSSRLNLALVTVVAVIYLGLSIMVWRWAGLRCERREGASGQNIRDVCGRCDGEPALQVRGNEVEAGGGARAGASA